MIFPIGAVALFGDAKDGETSAQSGLIHNGENQHRPRSGRFPLVAAYLAWSLPISSSSHPTVPTSSVPLHRHYCVPPSLRIDASLPSHRCLHPSASEVGNPTPFPSMASMISSLALICLDSFSFDPFSFFCIFLFAQIRLASIWVVVLGQIMMI